MALPKIEYPTFEVELPISKQKFKFRPFLVKDERNLLIARENNTEADLINGIIQLVNNCSLSPDVDLESLPMVELEFLFLYLRAKSVDNVASVTITDEDDKQQYNFDVDINDVVISNIDKSINYDIKLTNDIGVKMKMPEVKSLMKMNASTDGSVLSVASSIMRQCIDSIYDKETVYEMADHSQEELDEFVDQLQPEQFKNITDFFNDLPKIQYTINYENSNGTKKTYTIQGLQDFF